MSMVKLVIYGALGYMTYQMFFADLPAGGGRQGGGQGGARQGGRSQGQGAMSRGQGSQAGRANLTGAGGGRSVTAADPHGGTHTHTVGRGVIS